MNPAAAGGGETSVPSLLDKPLGELTEEDIAQLTREDCRRFLKLKGMRRPSWNKSQAIQQVISLKALLEDRPRKFPPPRPPVTSPETSHSQQQRVEDSSPYRRRDPTPTPTPTPTPIPPAALFTWDSRAVPLAEADVAAARDQLLLSSSSPRGNTDISLPPAAAQMTIFYGGLVNVYNDVPVEKARAILQVAASPVNPSDPTQLAVLPSGRGVQIRNEPDPVSAPGFLSSWPTAAGARPREDDDSPTGAFNDCPTGRQALLQRYRDKRKDRYKGKRIVGGSPSSMEMMFLSQKFRAQTPNGQQSSHSNTSSATQPKAPCTPTRCSRIESEKQKFCISVDLNDDGGGN